MKMLTHFVPVEKNLYRCDICNKQLSKSGKSTYNLLRHIRRVHPDYVDDPPGREQSDEEESSADETSSNTLSDESEASTDEQRSNVSSSDVGSCDESEDEETDAYDGSAEESNEDESDDSPERDEIDKNVISNEQKRPITQNDIDFLRVLQGATRRRRESLLRAADDHIILLIIEACTSLLDGTLGATQDEQKRLLPHRQIIRLLAEADISIKCLRKLLLQDSTFLPLLLPRVTTFLTTYFGR